MEDIQHLPGHTKDLDVMQFLVEFRGVGVEVGGFYGNGQQVTCRRDNVGHWSNQCYIFQDGVKKKN